MSLVLAGSRARRRCCGSLVGLPDEEEEEERDLIKDLKPDCVRAIFHDTIFKSNKQYIFHVALMYYVHIQCIVTFSSEQCAALSTVSSTFQ
jgi:hypothetical protein